MPELPEVETIRIGLSKKLLGLTIQRVDVLNANSFTGVVKDIEQKVVLDVWRKGKVLGINFSGGVSLLFHLKMSGQLVFQKYANLQKVKGETRFVGGHPTKDMAGEMPNKSTRVIFEFDNGSKLFFNDQRKFGWIKVVLTDQVVKINYGMVNQLGPEPLDEDFTVDILKRNLLQHSKMPVKVALMDQSVVAGVGNIYANEACFLAKIHPQTPISKLIDADFANLHKGVIKSLQDGITYGGSSRSNYINSDGEKGYFLDYAFVYGREKLSCKICNKMIQKIKLGGRGTFFCLACQLNR